VADLLDAGVGPIGQTQERTARDKDALCLLGRGAAVLGHGGARARPQEAVGRHDAPEHVSLELERQRVACAYDVLVDHVFQHVARAGRGGHGFGAARNYKRGPSRLGCITGVLSGGMSNVKPDARVLHDYMYIIKKLHASKESEDESKDDSNASSTFVNTSLQKEYDNLKKMLDDSITRFEQLRSESTTELSQRDEAIRLAQAHITAMFIESTKKLFVNIVPAVWTQLVNVKDDDGNAQPVASDAGILPVLQSYFSSRVETYQAYVTSMANYKVNTDKKYKIDYVETYVYKLIGKTLEDIQFNVQDTAFHYSLTKALTPFVLHMFVQGQHIPNICVCFILDMCIHIPLHTQYASLNSIARDKLSNGTAQRLVQVCLDHMYASKVSEEEITKLRNLYIKMYDTFAATYNKSIESSFPGVQQEKWPLDGDILKMQALLIDPTEMSDFRNLWQPLLRF